jgi:hypothetical protein
VAATAVASGAAASSLGIFAIMSSSKIILGTAGTVAALSLGTALYRSGQLNDARAEMATVNAQLRGAEARLALAQQEIRAAEADKIALKQTVDALKAASAAPPEPKPAEGPVTEKMVEARYQQAREAVASGDFAAALAGFLWCYDEGMPKVQQYGGVRNSFLLSELVRLGKIYPPALAALRERRDIAEEGMLDRNNREAAKDFAALNDVLNDDARTLEMYEKLPPNDPRGQGMLTRVYDLLIADRRYAEALQTRSFAQMVSQFESHTQGWAMPPNTPMPERIQKAQRRLAVSTGAKHIEVLAGVGDVANARVLIEKVLAYDASNETRTLLQTHLARAGHPELMSPPKP